MISKSSVTGICYFNGTEITQDEYDKIRAIIAEKPQAPDGYGYHLTDDLKWELYKLPAEEEADDEIGADEALDIILGGDQR